MNDTDKATPRPWRFEPHNGFGSDDPDGEPWPFGYISEDRPGSPIFELSPLLGHPAEQLYANAALIVRAVNERDELIIALRKMQFELNTLSYQAKFAATQQFEESEARLFDTLAAIRAKLESA